MTKSLVSILRVVVVSLGLAFMLPEVSAAEESAGEPATAVHPAIPSLDEISGEWKSLSWLAHYPSLHNFQGMLLCNKDLLSVSWLTAPPFSQGYHSGALYINGRIPKASQFRWYAYQALRKKQLEGFEVETTTRMVFEDNGVLFRIKLKNLKEQEQSLNLRIGLVGIISRFDDGWKWPIDQPSRKGRGWHWFETEAIRKNIGPIPNDFEQWKSSLQNQGTVLLISNTQTAAHTAFAFAQTPDKLKPIGNQGYAKWKITLKPGQTKRLDYVMAFGDKQEQVIGAASRWAKDFEAVFGSVKDKWQQRFNDMFTPGNKHFSGSLPVLVTSDKKLRRVYYMSALTLLVMHRTNLPVSNRVYLTGGPRMGATIMFYWDTSMWSTVFAMLDPEPMKEHLKRWLKLDVDRYFAQDLYGGGGVGNMYSASRMAIFKMIYAYLRVSGDTAFLNEKINGKTILQHMEELATSWKKMVRNGDVLADYGEANNLLECVPTYIHRVPSFNAASVWMMRMVAGVRESLGEKERPEQLRAEADRLAKAVLGLYVPTRGYWCSLHRDGSRVEMRHCYDFITVGNFMKDDLRATMKAEMVAFVERELLTDTWMRAQSLDDIAAKYSDRPDHGPMGAYDGWPAQTMDVMCKLGYFDKALDFLHRTEAVTYESTYSQGHEILGKTKDSLVRIAERDWHCRDESCGGAYADMIIRSMFGYGLDSEEDVKLFAPQVARGFEGKLLHLRHKGKLHTITSTAEGLSVTKE